MKVMKVMNDCLPVWKTASPDALTSAPKEIPSNLVPSSNTTSALFLIDCRKSSTSWPLASTFLPLILVAHVKLEEEEEEKEGRQPRRKGCHRERERSHSGTQREREKDDDDEEKRAKKPCDSTHLNTVSCEGGEEGEKKGKKNNRLHLIQ